MSAVADSTFTRLYAGLDDFPTPLVLYRILSFWFGLGGDSFATNNPADTANKKKEQRHVGLWVARRGIPLENKLCNGFLRRHLAPLCSTAGGLARIRERLARSRTGAKGVHFAV